MPCRLYPRVTTAFALIVLREDNINQVVMFPVRECISAVMCTDYHTQLYNREESGTCY